MFELWGCVCDVQKVTEWSGTCCIFSNHSLKKTITIRLDCVIFFVILWHYLNTV